MSYKIKNVYADKEAGYIEFWIKKEGFVSVEIDGTEYHRDVADSGWHKIIIK